jgi:hypothetical protein
VLCGIATGVASLLGAIFTVGSDGGAVVASESNVSIIGFDLQTRSNSS